MFTGLVEQVGRVEIAEDRRGQRKIIVKTGFTDLKPGDSMSVAGVCLTVTEAGAKGEAAFFVSEETLTRSTLGKLEAGSKVNLERAMQFGGRMGGHWVQGHVDAKGMVLNNVQGSDHHRVTVALDPKYGKYCVEKGSITIEGVSLTINAIQETRNREFMVTFVVIPHTWKNTTIGDLKIGDPVNVEVDILAKYIERLCPWNKEEGLMFAPADVTAEASAAADTTPVETSPAAEFVSAGTAAQPQENGGTLEGVQDPANP